VLAISSGQRLRISPPVIAVFLNETLQVFGKRVTALQLMITFLPNSSFIKKLYVSKIDAITGNLPH
jgi:hypothetical protein